MEYNLPIVGPVNQERAIEYGKNNLENLGPVLSILCLVVFMLTMVLTWLYLFCCALCCRKRPPKTTAHAPLSPSTARPLSVRSDAPLRTKPTSPRVLEDDPTDPAFTGVSAYDRVDALSRQNDEAAARAANKKTYSFKRFYTCSSILCGLSTICAAGVYLYQSKFDVSIKNLVVDVEDLTLNTAQFLCTSERASECRGRGVGQFVQKAQTKATRLLGDISTFLGTIDDILPSINATIDTLEGSKGDLQRIKLYAAMINSNVTAINQYKTWLLNPGLAGANLTTTFPSGNLPNISSEQLSFVDSGVTSVDQAVGSAKAVYANVNGVVTGQVASTISSLDPSTGSVAQGMLEPLSEMLLQLVDLRNQTLVYYHMVHDNAAFYGQYLQQKTLALTLLFFLPVIFQVLFMLCNVCKARRCKGCSFHLTLNMCMSCICIVFFLLFTLVFSLLATLSATVCDYHVLALQQAPTLNISLGTNNVVFDSTTIESVLNCPSGLNATDDNNFISILGLHELFNVSKQVGSATSEIRAAKASFSPDTQLESAMSQLNGMSNSTTFNVTETAPVSVFKNQLHALQDSLPDSDPDLDQEAQRTKLKDNYPLTTVSWSSYQVIITELNGMLGEATNIPPGFFRNYTFDMMHNFTVATVDAEPTWSAQFVATAPGTTFQVFRNKLGEADVYTYPVNAAVSANFVVQRNLTLVDAHLDKISTVVDRIGNTQASLANLKTNVNASLSATLVQANGVLRGLDAQVDKVETLPAFIVTAPEYARCGFVGDFYENGFMEGFCGEFRTSVAAMWPFMLAAAVSLYVSFMVFACHVRKPVWFLYPEDDGIELPGLSVASPRSARPAAIVA